MLVYFQKDFDLSTKVYVYVGLTSSENLAAKLDMETMMKRKSEAKKVENVFIHPLLLTKEVHRSIYPFFTPKQKLSF